MSKWIKVIESKREEIIEALKEAIKKAHGQMQGRVISVEIDEDDVWVNGLMSQNSQSISSFNNESYVVHSVESWECENFHEDSSEEEIEEEIKFIIDDTDFEQIIDDQIEQLKMIGEF